MINLKRELDISLKSLLEKEELVDLLKRQQKVTKYRECDVSSHSVLILIIMLIGRENDIHE
jgi:hypothetical protein